jgi:ribose transport system permease protein
VRAEVAAFDAEARMARPGLRRRHFEMRFVAIWFALAALMVAAAMTVPSSLNRTSITGILPGAAFLSVAAMGQTLVMMNGGLDLSAPAVITLVGVIILKVSKGSDANITPAIMASLAAASSVGLVNGVLITRWRLSPLVVTMAMGTAVTGGALWYRGGIPGDARVPPALANWGADRTLGLNDSFFVAVALMFVLAGALNLTTIGRRFTAVGANPSAAWIAGIPVQAYQVGAYVAASFLFGVTGILLTAFFRNPSLDIGDPYLLAPIVVVVLGGASLSGGPASMVATVGGALFLTFLNQVLRVKGLSSAYQYIIQGIALAVGMVLVSSNSRLPGRELFVQVARKARHWVRGSSSPTTTNAAIPGDSSEKNRRQPKQ